MTPQTPNRQQSETERTLRTLLDAMSEGMVLLSSTGVICDANRAATVILGVEKEDIIGRKYPDTPWRFLSPEGGPMAPDALPGLRSIKEGHTVCDVEMVVMQPDGNLRRVSASAAPLRSDEDALEGAVITLSDITVSHNIEQVLARNEAAMRAILEHAPFGILLIDKELKRIALANRYAADLVGRGLDQLEGRVCHDFICPTEMGKCPVGDMKQTMDNSERIVLTADGRRIPVLKTVVPVNIQEQSFLLDCFVDITDRKALETQLAQAQKLESVGRLAAGIAHEINTPAQYIGDNARFLQESFNQLSEVLRCFATLKDRTTEFQALDDARNAVETIIEEVDLEFLLEDVPNAVQQTIEGISHISTIVRAMKEFAHPGVEKKAPTDINAALHTTATVSRNEWKYAATIRFELDPTIPPVPCYPGEINQTFLNLIVNAAHAISDTQAERENTQGEIVLRTQKVEDFVEIRVEDNGCGIPTAIRDRVMDPFFTTKEVGRGTGQGLSIARSCIVDKHGGTLSFESTEGRGTVFVIRLPVSPQSEKDE